jgi:hypothetical protein
VAMQRTANPCTPVRFRPPPQQSRLYERTKLTDVQIARITGHTDLRMLKRYASLRGSDLAKSLW